MGIEELTTVNTKEDVQKEIIKTIKIEEEIVAKYIIRLDDIAIVVGSENIDLLILVSINETIVENIEIDDAKVNYEEEGEYTVTYHVSVNTDTLKEELADTENNSDYVTQLTTSITNGEEVEIEPEEFELYQQIYVVAEEDIETFQNENPDITVYTTGMELYEASDNTDKKTAEDYKEDSNRLENDTEGTTATYTETAVTAYTMYATTALNVRSEPNANATKLFTLSTNQAVSVSAEVDNGWVYVSTESGKTGYCNAYYLSTEKTVVKSSSSSSSSSSSNSSSSSTYSSITVVDGVFYRGNCTDAEWDTAVNYWYQMPSGLRSAFINNGWTMTITNNDFWSAHGYSSIAGLSVFNTQQIWIRASNLQLSTIGHELGHFLDYTNGWPSQTDTFLSLFGSESAGFTDTVDNQSKDNAYEYFASIVYHLISASSVENSAPNSFAFVRQYANW